MGVKVTAYFAASLDGFIAKEDGSIDWLNEASGIVPSGEDCGFQAFIDTVDVLVMGRNTFEQVSPFGELESEVVLTQLDAKVYDFGFVQIAYSVGANV